MRLSLQRPDRPRGSDELQLYADDEHTCRKTFSSPTSIPKYPHCGLFRASASKMSPSGAGGRGADGAAGEGRAGARAAVTNSRLLYVDVGTVADGLGFDVAADCVPGFGDCPYLDPTSKGRVTASAGGSGCNMRCPTDRLSDIFR